MFLCLLQSSRTVSGAVHGITTNYLHMSAQEARLSQGPWGEPLQRLKGHRASKCSQSSAWLVQSYSTEQKSPQENMDMESSYTQMKILTYQSHQTPFSFSALERLQLPGKTCCSFALSSCCPVQQCPKRCVPDPWHSGAKEPAQLFKLIPTWQEWKAGRKGADSSQSSTNHRRISLHTQFVIG